MEGRYAVVLWDWREVRRVSESFVIILRVGKAMKLPWALVRGPVCLSK